MSGFDRSAGFGVVNWQRRRRPQALGIFLAIAAGGALVAGVAVLLGARGLGLSWFSPVVLVSYGLIAPGLLVVSRALFQRFSG